MKLKENFKRFWTLSKSRKGFTLVELIVVIAILAILAGVAIPVYNGYIKKAQTAGDQQLADAINTAFAAACISNGGVQEVPATITIDEQGLFYTTDANGNVVSYSISVNSAYADAILADFAVFFAGNTDSFKSEAFVDKTFVMPIVEGGGSDATVSVTLPGGGVLTLTAAQLDLIKNSTYSKDIGGLMTQVNGVGGLVAGLLQDSGDAEGAAAALIGFMSDDDYLTKAIVALGGTVDPNGNLQDQYTSIVGAFKEEQAINKLASQLGVNPEDIDINGVHSDAYNEIIGGIDSEVDKNILVLGIAQSAASQTKDGAMNIINSNDPKGTLLNAMLGQGADTASGMGNAALVYGAFTAYANSDSATAAAKAALANSSDPTAVFDVLSGDELVAFQTYMQTEQGQADMDACIAAMDVINNTATDPNAVNGVISNGFANEDFVSALEGLLK